LYVQVPFATRIFARGSIAAYRAISHNGPAGIIVRSQEPTYSLRIPSSSSCSRNLNKFAPTLFECRKKSGGLVWRTW